MESSKMFGGEECHSSESGWTMYLGSSINGDVHIQNSYYDDEDDENLLCRNGKNNYFVQGGEDSDDSMASDASSGQIRHFNLKDDDVEDEDSKCSNKQTKIIENGTRAIATKKEKDSVARGGKTRKSHSFTAPVTSSKVRKSSRMGKVI